MTNRIVVACVSIAVSLALTGCGGGGGGGEDDGGTATPPQGSTATGVFLDARVAGLSYSSGTQSGVTDANGTFTYVVGQSVTFRVGGVTIGTVAAGKSAITPVDLVANGSGSSLHVQNIVRFLMLMDSDGNPANGLTISDALRSRAANWQPLDLATVNLETAVSSTSILGDTSVDTGQVRPLPSIGDAVAHLEGSVRCLYTGIFSGTYRGDDRGRWALVIGPAGQLAAGAYSTDENEPVALGFTNPVLTVQQDMAFVAGITGSGSTFNGTFTSLNEVSGTWTDGTFSGTRVAGSTASVIKNQTFLYRGAVPPSSGAILVAGIQFDINANDQVTAVVMPDVTTSAAAPTVTATLTGDALSATMSTGAIITATLNRTNGAVNGTWANGTDGGAALGPGCLLL